MVAVVGEGEELGVEAEVEAVLRGVLHQDRLEQRLREVEVPAWAGFVVFALGDGFLVRLGVGSGRGDVPAFRLCPRKRYDRIHARSWRCSIACVR